MAIMAYTKAGKKAYRAEFEYKGKRYTKAGFRTQGDAKDWTAAEKRALKKQSANPEQPDTLTPALMYSATSAIHLADCRSRQQPGTYAEKARHLQKFGDWLGGDIPLSNITPRIAQDHIADIQSATTNKTANRHLCSLKSFWNWISRREWLGPNPFNAVEAYPEEKSPRYVPSTEDVAIILSVAEEWELDFLHVLAKTGARPIEIRTLTWGDVDFSRVFT